MVRVPAAHGLLEHRFILIVLDYATRKMTILSHYPNLSKFY